MFAMEALRNFRMNVLGQEMLSFGGRPADADMVTRCMMWMAMIVNINKAILHTEFPDFQLVSGMCVFDLTDVDGRGNKEKARTDIGKFGYGLLVWIQSLHGGNIWTCGLLPMYETAEMVGPSQIV